jgi:hypothetical protein
MTARPLTPLSSAGRYVRLNTAVVTPDRISLTVQVAPFPRQTPSQREKRKCAFSVG